MVATMMNVVSLRLCLYKVNIVMDIHNYTCSLNGKIGRKDVSECPPQMAHFLVLMSLPTVDF